MTWELTTWFRRWTASCRQFLTATTTIIQAARWLISNHIYMFFLFRSISFLSREYISQTHIYTLNTLIHLKNVKFIKFDAATWFNTLIYWRKWMAWSRWVFSTAFVPLPIGWHRQLWRWRAWRRPSSPAALSTPFTLRCSSSPRKPFPFTSSPSSLALAAHWFGLARGQFWLLTQQRRQLVAIRAFSISCSRHHSVSNDSSNY